MKVRWTKIAKDDFEAAFHYISKDNPKLTKKLGVRLLSVLATLEEHPHAGRPGRVAETKEFIISGTPYVLIYTVKKDLLAIVSFLHSSRRWPPRM